MQQFWDAVDGIVGDVEDEAEGRLARLVAGSLLVALPLVMLTVVIDVLSQSWVPATGGVLGVVLAVSVLGLLRAQRRSLAFHGLVLGIALLTNGVAAVSGGLFSGSFAANAMLVVFGAVMLNRAWIPVLIAVPLAAMVWLESAGVEPAVVLPLHVHVVTWTLSLTVCGVVVAGLMMTTERAIEAATVAQGRAEDALASLEASSVSHHRVQALLDALDEYVLETTPEGVIVSANHMVRHRAQWGPDVVGKEVTELFADLPQGAFKRGQARMLRADGTALAVVLSRTEVPSLGLFVWTATDITELAATTDALRNAHRQASAANDAKSNFLANMSHELRTPLNAIIGYSELLADDMVEPEARDDLGRIVRAASSLLALINGVLDLSKVESGTVDLKLAETSLKEIVDEPISFIRPGLAAKGLELVLDLPDDLQMPVHTDQAKLRQVVINLLSNATKFTDEGSVTLRVTPWERSRLPWLRFEVIDTGVGMTGEDLELVFEPFAQAKPSDASTKQQGTGLGLSICKAFVEMLGGQIYAESALGQGTRFVVEVPAAELHHLTPSRTPTLDLEGLDDGSYRILLVDDDQEFLELMQRVLLSDDRQVLATPDPAQALAIAERYAPDLIIVDVDMPEMSGWSFMVRLRETACAETPVMVVSGLLEEEVAAALGSVATLTKPVPPHVMRNEVTRILSGAWDDDPTTNG